MTEEQAASIRKDMAEVMRKHEWDFAYIKGKPQLIDALLEVLRANGQQVEKK